MAATRAEPLIFSTDLSLLLSIPGETPQTPPSSLRENSRTVTRVDTSRGFRKVTLKNNKYYIPIARSNPLFDSFTIFVDKSSTVISIFQITTSRVYKGSTDDYLNIRKLMTHVGKLLQEQGLRTKIKVVYILVCPDDGLHRKWEMPAGWNEDTGKNDHRGDVFCQRIPTLPHGVSRLFTPNFGIGLNIRWCI